MHVTGNGAQGHLLAHLHATYVHLQANKHQKERYKNTHSCGYQILRVRLSGQS